MTTFTLEYPVNIDGELVSEITLNRLKQKDQRLANAALVGTPPSKANTTGTAGDFAKYQTILISASTGLSSIDFDSLDAADANALWEEVESFLSRPKDSKSSASI